MSTVVVLNGTSSSGKTAIARAFQETVPSLFLNVSIDTILYALPPSALQRIVDGADISDLRYPELVRGFYACVRQLADLGHDLIIDNAITKRDHAEMMMSALAGHDALFVALDCGESVLAARELARGDRTRGLAAHQFRSIHQWLAYDLRIASDQITPEAAAKRIIEQLERSGSGG